MLDNDPSMSLVSPSREALGLDMPGKVVVVVVVVVIRVVVVVVVVVVVAAAAALQVSSCPLSLPLPSPPNPNSPKSRDGLHRHLGMAVQHLWPEPPLVRSNQAGTQILQWRS